MGISQTNADLWTHSYEVIYSFHKHTLNESAVTLFHDNLLMVLKNVNLVCRDT